MSKENLLNDMVEEGLGYLKASDAVSAGVSRTYLANYVRANGLERVAYGLYRAEDAWDDGMYVLQCRYPDAVFSHESALFLLGLTDREPERYTITLRAGSSSSSLASEGVRVRKSKADLFDLGLVASKSPFGHAVRAYNTERTICDIVRKRNSVDPQDLQGVLKAYARSKDRDIPLLMRYAKALSVDKTMSRYLEVLI